MANFWEKMSFLLSACSFFFCFVFFFFFVVVFFFFFFFFFFFCGAVALIAYFVPFDVLDGRCLVIVSIPNFASLSIFMLFP